jgi:hypothetical protein
MARPIVLVAAILLTAACDSLTTWFVPDVTCAEWRNLAEEERSSIAEQIVRADGLFEAVQVAQQVPPATPEHELSAMASGSITKHCDLRNWNPAVRVRSVVREIYAPADVGAVTS